MVNNKPNILCLSRSYLSQLLPTLGQHDNTFNYLHIVQTDQEEQRVKSLGGVVVLNMQQCVRQALSSKSSFVWKEPSDMRVVTGFLWSPIYSDRYLPHFNVLQRNSIAGALQHAVEKLFIKHRFEGFLSEPVALFITHLIFYHCIKNETKPLFWCNTYFSNYFYFSAKTEISVPLRHKSMVEEESKDLRDQISAYVNGIIEDKVGPLYHHSFSSMKQNPLGYFKQRNGEAPLVLRPGWTSRVIQIARLARALCYRLTFRMNGDFMTAGSVKEQLLYLNCLFASKYIYDKFPENSIEQNVVYALQYEPEASLLYFAPYIVNQISFVETALKALPSNRILWVKEHPNQFGALDTRSWRRLKARYCNLRFIHGRENGRELIKRSSLVITISSSMGMDALLLGRSLLVAGKVFYNCFTGAIQIHSYEDLARELNTFANYKIRDNAQANANELFKFGCNAYQGDPQPSHYLYDKKNIDFLLKSIKSELQTC